MWTAERLKEWWSLIVSVHDLNAYLSDTELFKSESFSENRQTFLSIRFVLSSFVVVSIRVLLQARHCRLTEMSMLWCYGTCHCRNRMRYCLLPCRYQSESGSHSKSHTQKASRIAQRAVSQLKIELKNVHGENLSLTTALTEYMVRVKNAKKNVSEEKSNWRMVLRAEKMAERRSKKAIVGEQASTRKDQKNVSQLFSGS